jgi:hypothetical protein
MIRGKQDFIPGDVALDSEDEIGYEDEEDASPSPVKLEVLVPDDYEEEAATDAALAASKADEESKWSFGVPDLLTISHRRWRQCGRFHSEGGKATVVQWGFGT